MKVAIITGASSGIGEAVAIELHRRGWRVGLIARREEKLRSITDALGDNAEFATADVVDESELIAAVRSLESRLGPCDLMVANAGIGDGRSARGFSSEATKRILRVNVDGVIHAIAAVLPGMVERGVGALAVTSSVASFRGLPNFGAYCASKACVSALTEAIRVDLQRTNINVTTIHPGFVVSELTDQNGFNMPFLVQTPRAARIIANGIERGKAEINFPWQMICLMKIVQWTPNWLYDRLVVVFSPTNPKKDAG